MSGEGDRTPKAVRSVWPAIVLAGFAIVMIVWSSSYSETARMVPTLVGWGMLALCVIDILSRLDLPFSQFLKDFWGADFRNREMKHNPPWRADVGQFLWMSGFVAGMLFFGILPSVPVFVMAYMAFHGGRHWLECLVAGAIVFGFVFVVFEVLLQYQLYRGVIFDERGFANW
jgi:hypothetical protein